MVGIICVRMNEDKVKIRLSIAGEQFVLAVPYSQQEETRATEAEVNMLFDTWRSRFPDKSDRELLAMIAFRYAERYMGLQRDRDEAAGRLGEIGERLQRLVAEGSAS